MRSIHMYKCQGGYGREKRVEPRARLGPRVCLLSPASRSCVLTRAAAAAAAAFCRKNGNYWNMIMQGDRYQSNDNTFHSWSNKGPMIGKGEHGGQWWIPVPNQVDGSPPPARPAPVQPLPRLVLRSAHSKPHGSTHGSRYRCGKSHFRAARSPRQEEQGLDSV